MKLSPQAKQVISGLLMGVGSATAVAVEQALANPPFTFATLWHAAITGALIGFAHWLPTLGTKDAIEAKANDKAIAAVAAVVGREP